MTAVQPPLFLPGWEREPCADADERAHVDLHGPQRVRRTRLTERDIKWLNDFETVDVVGGVL